MRHYTYLIREVETGEFYIGVRSCKCEPNTDKYMGSMVTWKPNKSNLVKTILREFNSREEAMSVEDELIKLFVKDGLNRNYNISGNFHAFGLKRSEEHKAKISLAIKGRVGTRLGLITSEETKLKISLSKRGTKYKKIKCPYCGIECNGGNLVRWHLTNCKMYDEKHDKNIIKK